MRVKRLGDFSSDCRVHGVIALHQERYKNWQGHAPYKIRVNNYFMFIHKGGVDFRDEEKTIIPTRLHNMIYIPKGAYCSSVYYADVTEITVVMFQLSDEEGDFVLSDTIEVMPPDQAVRYEPLFYAFHKTGPGVNQALHKTGALYDLLTQLNLSNYDEIRDKNYVLISPGVELLVERFRENISISEMARASMISECYFRRLFKRFFRQSPIAYRNYLRLQYANDLYASGLYTMGEAAAAAGIENASYFSRLNKRYISPPV